MQEHTKYPTKFVYTPTRTSGRLSSTLWYIWLCFPSRLRMMVYRLLWHHGTETSARVKRLAFGLYAKETFHDEPLVTQYVAKHTTIPVPTILDVIPFEGSYWPEYCVLVVMSAVPGTPLSATTSEWGTPEDARNVVFRDVLSDWLVQLRRLPAPDPVRVCGFLGGPFKSYRIDGQGRVGPFVSVREFQEQHYFEPDVTAYENENENEEDVVRLIEARPHKKYKIVLTHGDMSFHNILVDEEYKPVGLVDWECAGWMPEYWEYTSAMFPVYHQNEVWKAAFDRVFLGYGDELRVEFESWKWWHPD